MEHCKKRESLLHEEHHGRHGYHGRMNGFDIEEASLWELLIRCGYIAERKSGRQRGQNRILDILLKNPEMSQKTLQEQLGIEPGSMSEILGKLEEKGFLTKEKDENDRRRMLIRLTEEGKKAAKAEDVKGSTEGIFSSLKEEEQEQLKEMLQRLLKQWKMERQR